MEKMDGGERDERKKTKKRRGATKYIHKNKATERPWRRTATPEGVHLKKE